LANRLPRVTGPEVLRALQRGGWHRVTPVGSHVQLKHPTRGGRVTVPVHRGRTLRLGTLNKILEQAGLTAAELRSLL
jgi:predicted RNA binding protein YcfA (HicA-like mRNA interferase family)